jgi:hypothetical protein
VQLLPHDSAVALWPLKGAFSQSAKATATAKTTKAKTWLTSGNIKLLLPPGKAGELPIALDQLLKPNGTSLERHGVTVTVI